LKTAWCIACVVAVLLAVANYPQPLFAWSATEGNLSLCSDEEFTAEHGNAVLRVVQGKLLQSPLYSTEERFSAFICNSRWRRVLFLGGDRGGGSTRYPVSTHIFLSGASVGENRLISPSGKSDLFGRSLDHFIAHEIAHVLTGKAAGPLALHTLPDWIVEGYAEYVGWGGAFDLEEGIQAFLQGEPRMTTPPAVPYLRYCLLVTYLLEGKAWSVEELLAADLAQGDVEAMLRADAAQRD
jgi:hypothetical protein